eukprot:2630154-Prymnesium_polylepis.1
MGQNRSPPVVVKDHPVTPTPHHARHPTPAAPGKRSRTDDVQRRAPPPPQRSPHPTPEPSAQGQNHSGGRA